MEFYAAVKKKELLPFGTAPREYYAKCNKPVRERQVPYDFMYMWNLMNKIN